MAELTDTAEHPNVSTVDRYGPSKYDSGRGMSPDRVESILLEVPLEYDQDMPILNQLKTPISEKGTQIRRLSPKLIAMLCLGIVFVIASLSVVIGSTTRRSDRNESNASDNHTGAGFLDDAPSSKVCGDLGITCRDDRLSFGVDLIKGEAICSKDGKYMFGISQNGSLIWSECDSNNNRVEYYKGVDGHYFVLLPDATLQVGNKYKAIVWEKKCTKSFFLGPGKCMPKYDCPYLHLHKHHGGVILNWIDKDEVWESSNIKRAYDF